MNNEKMIDKKVVDKCYENFPMFSLVSQGCNCFFNEFILSLEKIIDFLFHLSICTSNANYYYMCNHVLQGEVNIE